MRQIVSQTITLLIILGLVIGAILAVKWLKDTNRYPLKETANCQPNTSPSFTANITDLDKIDYIIPPPTSQEPNTKRNSLQERAMIVGTAKMPLYAPANSTLYRGAHYREADINQYVLFFQVSCEVTYVYDHVVDPVDKVRDAFSQASPNDPHPRPSVKFSAGELIGYSINEYPSQWEFGTYTSHKPDSSDENGEDFIPTCPFDFFQANKKAKYYSKVSLPEGSNQTTTLCSDR